MMVLDVADASGLQIISVVLNGVLIPACLYMIRVLNSIREQVQKQNGRVRTLEAWREEHAKLDDTREKWFTQALHEMREIRREAGDRLL